MNLNPDDLDDVELWRLEMDGMDDDDWAEEEYESMLRDHNLILMTGAENSAISGTPRLWTTIFGRKTLAAACGQGGKWRNHRAYDWDLEEPDPSLTEKA